MTVVRVPLATCHLPLASCQEVVGKNRGTWLGKLRRWICSSVFPPFCSLPNLLSQPVTVSNVSGSGQRARPSQWPRSPLTLTVNTDSSTPTRRRPPSWTRHTIHSYTKSTRETSFLNVWTRGGEKEVRNPQGTWRRFFDKQKVTDPPKLDRGFHSCPRLF